MEAGNTFLSCSNWSELWCYFVIYPLLHVELEPSGFDLDHSVLLFTMKYMGEGSHKIHKANKPTHSILWTRAGPAMRRCETITSGARIPGGSGFSFQETHHLLLLPLLLQFQPLLWHAPWRSDQPPPWQPPSFYLCNCFLVNRRHCWSSLTSREVMAGAALWRLLGSASVRHDSESSCPHDGLWFPIQTLGKVDLIPPPAVSDL